SLTCSGRTFARASASRTTTAPSSTAGTSARPPRYLPMGVRTADRITASLMFAPSGQDTNDKLSLFYPAQPVGETPPRPGTVRPFRALRQGHLVHLRRRDGVGRSVC